MGGAVVGDLNMKAEGFYETSENSYKAHFS
jgi:hypothetical protein